MPEPKSAAIHPLDPILLLISSVPPLLYWINLDSLFEDGWRGYLLGGSDLDLLFYGQCVFTLVFCLVFARRTLLRQPIRLLTLLSLSCGLLILPSMTLPEVQYRVLTSRLHPDDPSDSLVSASGIPEAVFASQALGELLLDDEDALLVLANALPSDETYQFIESRAFLAHGLLQHGWTRERMMQESWGPQVLLGALMAQAVPYPNHFSPWLSLSLNDASLQGSPPAEELSRLLPLLPKTTAMADIRLLAALQYPDTLKAEPLERFFQPHLAFLSEEVRDGGEHSLTQADYLCQQAAAAPQPLVLELDTLINREGLSFQGYQARLTAVAQAKLWLHACPGVRLEDEGFPLHLRLSSVMVYEYAQPIYGRESYNYSVVLSGVRTTMMTTTNSVQVGSDTASVDVDLLEFRLEGADGELVPPIAAEWFPRYVDPQGKPLIDPKLYAGRTWLLGLPKSLFTPYLPPTEDEG